MKRDTQYCGQTGHRLSLKHPKTLSMSSSQINSEIYHFSQNATQLLHIVVKSADALLASFWTLSLGPASSARSWLLLGPNPTPNRRSRLSISLEFCCLLIGRERTILAPDWP